MNSIKTPEDVVRLSNEAAMAMTALAAALTALGRESMANTIRENVRAACDAAAYEADENARQKGPMLIIERVFARRGGTETAEAELLRCTGTLAIVSNGHGQVQRFRLADGRQEEKPSRLASSWLRVSEASLPIARAMKPGANDVSKAWEAVQHARRMRREASEG